MYRNAWLLAAAVAIFSTHTARATHFVVTSAGPHDSVGPWFTAGNALLFPNWPGPMYLSNKITVSGTLTQVHPESYASDSTWWLKASTGTGTAFSFIPQITFTTTYTTLNLSHNTYGGYWIGNYPQYRFEAVEMGVGAGDQPGIDAQWTNMTFEFHPFVPTVSIGWATGTVAAFDTGGSSFNTRMGIYSLTGELLDQSVGDAGMVNEIDASGLAPGEYYLIVAAENGDFQDLAALPGDIGGDLRINFNGSPLFAGALEPERVMIVSVNVVPEPTAALPWLLGVIAMATRAGRRAPKPRRSIPCPSTFTRRF
jgi:hypothetical protein